MASFVPNHRKKIEQLQKREQELRRLITRGVSHDKLLEAALQIRDSRIRVLRAHQNQTHPLKRESFEKDRIAIEALLALPAESILADYLPGS